MDKYFKKTISIIIPCFNEKEGIANLSSKLSNFEKKLKEQHELVFVDDGSSDNTYERLLGFYKERVGKDVKIIRHSRNKGVGAALKTGITNANGDYVAVIDSDCTYKLEYLLEMLNFIRKENADIITASPYHPQGSTLNVPGYRLFLSRGLSNLYNIISKNKLYTYTSMFRIYRAEILKNIDFKSDGFLAMAEILIKAHKSGCRILEFPATLTGRKFGVSNAKSLKLIREHLAFIAKILQKKGDI